MKKVIVVVCCFVILAAIGAGFYFWQDILLTKAEPTMKIKITHTPEPTSFLSGLLPFAQDDYKIPDQNQIIKFPIFNYHHIRPMPPETAHINQRTFTVTPEGLEEHLKFFKENGYNVVPIGDLIEYYDTGKPLPAKAVAITFDDGRYGQYKWALPLLQQYGIKATFFIVAHWVDKKDPDIMTWNQIRELDRAGMVIGSHTLEHPPLSKLNDIQLMDELVNSKKKIEEELGHAIEYLAYPGGDYNEHVIEKTKEAGYRAAMGVYKIIDQAPKYRYAVRRFHADDWLESISGKLTEY